MDIKIGRVYHNDIADCYLRVVPTGLPAPQYLRYQIEALPGRRGGWGCVWRGHDLDQATEKLATYFRGTGILPNGGNSAQHGAAWARMF